MLQISAPHRVLPEQRPVLTSPLGPSTVSDGIPTSFSLLVSFRVVLRPRIGLVTTALLPLGHPLVLAGPRFVRSSGIYR
jgi:hypothetical protein